MILEGESKQENSMGMEILTYMFLNNIIVEYRNELVIIVFNY